MKTLLVLVEDDYAEALQSQLPPDKAWLLPERYDAFRCRVHHAYEIFCTAPETFRSYQETMTEMNKLFEGEPK